MMRLTLFCLLLTLVGSTTWAQDQATTDTASAESVAAKEPEATEQATTDDELVADADKGDGISSPKTMSGMSILGNEEAPKALVIIPWKSSRLGDEISLSDTLDDRAQPVDKEVFLRELRFYEIRSGEGT
jgi:hypothetical protein